MKVVDANVLLYAVNEDDQHHERARGWLDAALSGYETIGFTWVALLAFLRLSTKVGLFPRPLSVTDSCATITDWLGASPSVLLAPTVRHAAVLSGLLAAVGTGGNLVSDAHLAAIVLEHGASVVTFDNDFGRFLGVQWEPPGSG
ncbi:MAG TPA: type II toxin-antitoxin system VapC family toxin [Egibacteraceae bacterium]|nr:type II toxin-antitoxin system VapC family toxin [Egibacteraceae bacterium]